VQSDIRGLRKTRAEAMAARPAASGAFGYQNIALASCHTANREIQRRLTGESFNDES